MNGSGWFKARRRMVGIVFLAVIALLTWLAVSVYQQRFTPVVMVTLRADTVGNELHEHAEVKARGVVVGEVRQISAAGSGADLRLAIQPDMTHLLPANVTAQLLPKTLFGERYVDLVLPADPVAQRLGPGSVIGEDRSSSAIEVQKVLADLMPMLQAVQPEKISVTLTAISQALSGRGTELGQTLVRINSYLEQFNPQLPALDQDISELIKVADTYTDAAPDIISALDDFSNTSRTVVDEQSQLVGLYTTVTSAAGTITDFLRQNANTIIRLSADSLPTLRLLARYSPEFPCTLAALTDFEPVMDAALGKGTNHPGLTVDVTVQTPRGKYVPGVDTPAYTDTSGPHCYPAGSQTTGISLEGASPANSAQENEFVNELLGAGLGVPPSSLPGWSSLLAGPLYRGTEVSMK
ncbi:MAG TPA: MCE family protein [Pseudonocardiaceae bacterium]|jgi:phospholipid/cholesterol/gamma-HCH transport system substrate-binding protein|nr:MCE family protein [Pseudonocardiaceae bacterium]